MRWKVNANFETVKNQEISTDAQIAFALELKATVLPLLEKLKAANNGDLFQSTFLLDILETNLQHLVSSYGCETSLAKAYQQLTPVETLVASMVRQRLSTQDIAVALNVAPGTVNGHRTHIRKKLGLDSKTDNLQNHLLSLT
jgi:DNA-binding CsgD family transcriptional regulator